MNHNKFRTPPGSITYTGKERAEPVTIHYIQYDETHLLEEQLESDKIEEIHESKPELVQWYDVRGIHDTDLIRKIGNSFGIHPLVLEDITDVNQRPKYQEYENGILIILHTLKWKKNQPQNITKENIGLFLGDGFLLSFQEDAEDSLKIVRNRIRQGVGRIRKRKTDYLLDCLIDDVIDEYFELVQVCDEEIERYENMIQNKPSEQVKRKVHQLKKDVLVIRKSIFPLRESLNRLYQTEHPYIVRETKPFIRHLLDHVSRIIDMIDTNREMIGGLQDLYNSEIGYRTNAVMKVLTMVTSVFVPLSFIAAVYGMNFDFMPELRHKYGYFIVITIMLIIGLFAFLYFKRKRWL